MSATLFASQALSSVTPKTGHVGPITVVSTYSLTASLSAGDIIRFCKLPTGARVTNVELMTNVNPFAMAGVVNVGYTGTPTKFIASVTPSANLKFTINQAAGFGFELSLTDNATPYSYVEMKVTTSGTGTKSGAISCLVTYTMDQPEA